MSTICLRLFLGRRSRCIPAYGNIFVVYSSIFDAPLIGLLKKTALD